MSTKIIINKNGSLKVEGTDFTVTDLQGNEYSLGGRTRISFCRCGASSTQPFCDGKHREIGFSTHLNTRSLPPLSPPRENTPESNENIPLKNSK